MFQKMTRALLLLMLVLMLGAIAMARPADAPVSTPNTTPTEADVIRPDLPEATPASTPSATPSEAAIAPHLAGAGAGAMAAALIDGADAAEATGRLTGLKIGIDPGHQLHANNAYEPIAPGSKHTKPKVSSGTQGVKTRASEHAVNLQVSLKLKEALLAEGAEVLMTRETEDVDISNIERAVMMNEAGADLVLRIHCNGSEGPGAKGTELFVRKTGSRADECDAAAQVLLKAMVEATGAKKRGVTHNDSYTGLNWSEVPSILVEMGFMSNPAEDVLLSDPEYQDKLVSGMVEGIAEYFGRN
ncbi:N-acetylmuramoyl-L-alanine amidase [Bacillota bacterium Meth-B3]|nr:N-acetylmuramoyl-L-alanine amidase [Christensenellaceae bacterium]MEA5065292.1 N-acetylmuramoyl-L-alanine amidase [Eubacteriales bacterium]MEA5070019.1 N-acetylmuramoyl-L-alanine amidase [Christensenellaceae bacterium]